MRDFASCFPDVSCSAAGVIGGSFAVVHTSVYKSILSTRKEVHVKISWSKPHTITTTGGSSTIAAAVASSPSSQLAVAIEDGISSRRSSKPNETQVLNKRKGSRSFVTENSVVGLYWDISGAKYGSGPEPVKDFYVAVIVDGEFSLLLGDMSRDFVKFFESAIPIAKFSLLTRKEQVRGATTYSTTSRFRSDGKEHEISIRCKGDEMDCKDSELSVSIDKKKVVHVRRLKWNFRGNQTIFIDGSVVDMMWDVHDWWFANPAAAGCALFMFKTRVTAETRLWLEDELARHGQGKSGFFLLIQAFKKQLGNGR
ncbi:uncharacterized protein [Typha latifolia]|uniref:uncharacterized protein n=1 Tax=Typha latifolia TaxID=4733 RepID=UPI003C2E8252